MPNLLDLPSEVRIKVLRELIQKEDMFEIHIPQEIEILFHMNRAIRAEIAKLLSLWRYVQLGITDAIADVFQKLQKDCKYLYSHIPVPWLPSGALDESYELSTGQDILAGIKPTQFVLVCPSDLIWGRIRLEMGSVQGVLRCMRPRSREEMMERLMLQVKSPNFAMIDAQEHEPSRLRSAFDGSPLEIQDRCIPQAEVTQTILLNLTETTQLPGPLSKPQYTYARTSTIYYICEKLPSTEVVQEIMSFCAYYDNFTSILYEEEYKYQGIHFERFVRAYEALPQNKRGVRPVIPTNFRWVGRDDLLCRQETRNLMEARLRSRIEAWEMEPPQTRGAQPVIRDIYNDLTDEDFHLAMELKKREVRECWDVRKKKNYSVVED